MRYKCPMCGYIFDEEKEGKTIDELGVCPMCGVPSETFIPIDEDGNEIRDAEFTKKEDSNKSESGSEEKKEHKGGHGKSKGHGHGKSGSEEKHGGKGYGHGGHKHQYGKKRKLAQNNSSNISNEENTGVNYNKKASPEEIKKWFDLLKEGAITQEEYDKKKKELL